VDIDQKRAKSARTRNLTAAKKYLGLIIEDAGKAQAALEGGTLPDGSLAASTGKYEYALAMLKLLDSLSNGTMDLEPEPDASPAGPVPVVLEPGDVGLLIQVMRGQRLIPADAGPGDEHPVNRLIKFAFPDGIPDTGTVPGAAPQAPAQPQPAPQAPAQPQPPQPVPAG
jgi:hypothetical protein